MISLHRQLLLTSVLALGILYSSARGVENSLLEKKTPKSLDLSLVWLTLSSQEVDLEYPWKRSPVRNSKSFGVVVTLPQTKELGILAPCSVVWNSTRIEMQRYSQSHRSELTLAFADPEANLALLKPKDLHGLRGLIPLEIYPQIPLNQSVALYLGRDNLSWTNLKATLLDVFLGKPVTSSYALPTYSIKVQQKNLGFSEPLILEKKLAGIVTSQDSESIYAIPGMVIKHFLEDELNENYKGFPALNINTKNLIAPMMRKSLEADSYTYGVRIQFIEVNSPLYNVAMPDDVLLSINDQKISDQGTLAFDHWGDLSYTSILTRYYSGDSVILELLRNGTPKKFNVVLPRYFSNDAMIPHYRFNEREPFLIFGGLVFQELTVDYLKTWGSDWLQESQSDLLYIYMYKNQVPAQKKDRYIVLSRLLADELNRGYESMSELILENVNGLLIRSMSQLEEALDKPIFLDGEKFAQFSFKRGKGEIVLSYKDLNRAHKRLSKQYGIPLEGSFYSIKGS